MFVASSVRIVRNRFLIAADCLQVLLNDLRRHTVTTVTCAMDIPIADGFVVCAVFETTSCPQASSISAFFFLI